MADETITKATPKSRQPKANISPEALQAMVESMNEMRAMVEKYKAEAVAAHKAMSEDKPATMSIAGKTSKQVQNEIQTIRAFKKAGFGTVTPHLNVKTFNRWMAEGRRPAEGSKSIKAGGLRLFHLSQTRPLTSEELKAAKASDQPKAAKPSKGAKVVPIHSETEIPF